MTCFVAYEVLPGIILADPPKHLHIYDDANVEGILQALRSDVAILTLAMRLLF